MPPKPIAERSIELTALPADYMVWAISNRADNRFLNLRKHIARWVTPQARAIQSFVESVQNGVPDDPAAPFDAGLKCIYEGLRNWDSHGNAGLRDKVDRHYLRILGFSVLTSMFTAAFEISQRTSQSALTLPTPTQTAGSAVGQEPNQTGAQITRRNLNVQPTINVPAGYKFTVRVNRDILFEAPYSPVLPNLLIAMPPPAKK